MQMTKTKKTSVKKTQKCKFRLQKFTKQCKKTQKHKNVRSEASVKTSQNVNLDVTKSHKLVQKRHEHVNLDEKKSQASLKKLQKCEFR